MNLSTFHIIVISGSAGAIGMYLICSFYYVCFSLPKYRRKWYSEWCRGNEEREISRFRATQEGLGFCGGSDNCSYVIDSLERQHQVKE